MYIRQNLDDNDRKIPGNFLFLCKDDAWKRDNWDEYASNTFIRLKKPEPVEKESTSSLKEHNYTKSPWSETQNPYKALPYRKFYRHGGYGDGWYNDDNVTEKIWELGKRRFRMVVNTFDNKILEMEGDPCVAYAIERYAELESKYTWLNRALPEIEKFYQHGFDPKWDKFALKILKSYIVNSPKDVYRIYRENRWRSFTKKELLHLFYNASVF